MLVNIKMVVLPIWILCHLYNNIYSNNYVLLLLKLTSKATVYFTFDKHRTRNEIYMDLHQVFFCSFYCINRWIHTIELKCIKMQIREKRKVVYLKELHKVMRPYRDLLTVLILQRTSIENMRACTEIYSCDRNYLYDFDMSDSFYSSRFQIIEF